MTLTDGEIESNIFMNDSSSFIFQGGDIEGSLFSFSESRFEILNNLDARVLAFQNSTGLISGDIEGLWAYGSSETIVNAGVIGSVTTTESSRVEFSGGALNSSSQPAASVSGSSELVLSSVRDEEPRGQLSALVFHSGSLTLEEGVLDKVTVRNQGRFFLTNSRVGELKVYDDCRTFLSSGKVSELRADGGRTNLNGASFGSVLVNDGAEVRLSYGASGGYVNLSGGTLNLHLDSAYAFFPRDRVLEVRIRIEDGELILHGGSSALQTIVNTFGTDFPTSHIPEAGLTVEVPRTDGTILISRGFQSTGIIRIR